MGGRYSDLPDFVAYENYSSAAPNSNVITHTQGAFGDYIFFDMAAYAHANPQQQNNAEETLLGRAGEKSPEARDGMQRLLNMAKEGPTLTGYGGGTIIGGLDIALTDDRTVSLEKNIEKLYGRETYNVTPEQDQSYREFTRHHENAHLMLGLKEPGSDFMAAVIYLRQHPEDRQTLQTISDMRVVDGFKDGPGGLARYGAESYEAIQRALYLSPAQIKNTSIETLYNIALEYDQKNELNRSLKERSPEGEVFTALNDRITGGSNRSGLQRSWDVAAAHDYERQTEPEARRAAMFTPDAIRDALKNAPNLSGEARTLADTAIDAINRLDKVAGDPQAVAPVPALQRNSAAPATP